MARETHIGSSVREVQNIKLRTQVEASLFIGGIFVSHAKPHAMRQQLFPGR